MLETMSTKILTQCCGIILLLIILIYNGIRKKIRQRTSDNCIQLVIVTLVCSILDILSIFFIYLSNGTENGLLHFFTLFFCKSYNSSLMLVTAFGIRYICSDMFKTERQYKRALKISFISIIAEIIVLYAAPINIVLTDKVIYTTGPSSLIAYPFCFLNIFVLIFLIEKNKMAVNQQRRFTVYLWIAIWAACGVIQFISPWLLVVSFGAALGVSVIYFALENPEAHLDRVSGFFNKSALAQYAEQHYFNGVPFSLIYASLTGSGTYSKVSMETDVNNEINSYLSCLKGGEVFKTSEIEFAIAFENRVDAEDAFKLIQERFNYGWGEHKSSVLFLQYIFVPDSSVASDWELLSQAVRYADYTIHVGKNVAVVNEELVKQMVYEHDMEETIKEAIENNRIEVFYQPVYSIKKQKFVSAEALARIRRADGSIVPPGLFIPVAEKNGTIIKIGEIVFEEVCRFIQREAIEERFNVKFIEVNLSVVQCAYEKLADTFIAIMKANHINPAWINLEITESESVKSKEILLRNMNELIRHGVTFSLDDFGTGRSNLNYILDMPVEIVKFDREMTSAYMKQEMAQHIMSSTVKMLRDVNMEIVVEGVETKEQLDEICMLDVSYIQGYYFSKPIPAKEYVLFLMEHK